MHTAAAAAAWLVAVLLAAAPAAARVFPATPALARDAPDAWAALGAGDAQRLQRRVLEGLGFRSAPDARAMNVSHEEYERAHRQYVRAVRAAELRTASRDQPPADAPRFRTFFPQGASSSAAPTATAVRGAAARAAATAGAGATLHLSFGGRVAGARRGRARVEHAALRLLAPPAAETAAGAAPEAEVLLWALEGGDAQPWLVARTRLPLAEDAARWVEVDATAAATAWAARTGRDKHAEPLRLRLDCPSCAPSALEATRARPALGVLTRVRRAVSRSPPTPEGRPGALTRRARRAPFDRFSAPRGGGVSCRVAGARCCRHAMTVNFTDIGIGWVKQPQVFDIGMCRGRCPLRFNPAHPHAMMQALTARKYGPRKVPRPCCAPSKLGSLQILQPDPKDNSRLIVSEWENTTVLECACS